MRVLVTGANGYLGGAVVEALRADGHEVAGLVHGARARVPRGVPVQTADLLDTEAVTAAVREVDAVCHLAGLTRVRESLDDPLRYYEVNVGGTVSLLRAMAAAGVNKLVFASTASIYGTPERQPMTEDLPDRPPHPYAASKQAAESVIAAQASTGRLGAVVLRLFNIAGGDDPDPTRIVPRVLAAAGEGSCLSINGDGSVVRDYVHIDDAARAFAAAVAHLPEPGACRRYNIGSGIGVSVSELVAEATRLTGRTIAVGHGAAVPEPPRLIGDVDRARRELGWEPKFSDIAAILRDAWLSRQRT
ncbi:NAD-dependent epimerase/dehydratase family protein [Nocardia tenerifensis]|uniref:NAD-dependent epimerase/dehydratase family protein n=1 Tax=Nocardia tenerifensis TaxID=228006 RepID=UPI0002F07486|nr:NAD-dependent epimerase/dehydratase family protein [Nocardia tenerifensis]